MASSEAQGRDPLLAPAANSKASEKGGSSYVYSPQFGKTTCRPTSHLALC